MAEQSKKRSYKTPYIVDLSGIGAQGQVEGICLNGHNPVDYTCSPGPGPTQADACSSVGISPTFGGCTGSGGAAVEGCFQGSLFLSQCDAGGAFAG